MTGENATEFAERRGRLNEVVLKPADLSVKRFFALDRDVYEERALPKRAKERLGLVASTILRCDDGIGDHPEKAAAAGRSEAEIADALGIVLVVGGLITIAHVRHAFKHLETEA